LNSFDLISERLIRVSIKLYKEVLTIFQIHAPDLSYDDEAIGNLSTTAGKIDIYWNQESKD